VERLDRQRQVMAVALAGLAGFVDAVGFLSANGYFVSFMSGNTTRLGVNLARDRGAALVPALLICGFVLGVAAGSWLSIKAGARRKVAVLGLVSALLGGAAGLHSAGMGNAAPALLVIAMGALNTTFQREGGVAVGLTYMTGALVRLGQALGAGAAGERRTGWGAYLILWSGLALGAIAGAATQTYAAGIALWIATGWALAALIAAARLRRSA
jgi:uncharacterized membrane protein YoaK (UPF0700 family)